MKSMPLEAQSCQVNRGHRTIVDQNPIATVSHVLKERTPSRSAIVKYRPRNFCMSNIRTCYGTPAELHSVVTVARRIFRQYTSHIPKASEFPTRRADIVWTTTISILIPRHTVQLFCTSTAIEAARGPSNCDMIRSGISGCERLVVHLEVLKCCSTFSTFST